MFRLPIVGGLVWQTLAVPGMPDNQLSDFVVPSAWPDWPDRYRTQMRFRGFGRALRSTMMEGATLDLDTLYARVGARGTRALLIWGKEDATVSIANAPGVVAAIPQIRFETIERAGHLPHLERTDVVNPLLIGFLRAGAASRPAQDTAVSVAHPAGRTPDAAPPAGAGATRP
jgi:pimeloyl-ACP methyl ester carboxylesterase